MAPRRGPVADTLPSPRAPPHNTSPQIPTPACIASRAGSAPWATRVSTPPRQDPGRGSSPAGMEQRQDPGLGIDQVDRNAIGHRNREQQPRGTGGVPIEAIEDPPAIPARRMPGDVGAVALDGENLGVEVGQRAAQVAPALHDLADRLHGPEAEIEAWRALAAARDARDDAIPITPGLQLKTGDRARTGVSVRRVHHESREAADG